MENDNDDATQPEVKVKKKYKPRTKGKWEAGRKKVGDKLPTTMTDPLTSKSVAIPNELLPYSADTDDLVTRCNQLTRTIQRQALVLAEMREWFRFKRTEKEIDHTAVSLLAARGNNKATIAKLLGFNATSFCQRMDLQEAFDLGVAELSDALSNKQLETAFNEKGMPATTMQIFLGKVLLGQRDGNEKGAVNVQINNNTGSSLREKIRMEREKVVAAKQEWDSTVTTIDTEIVEGTVVDGSDGN